MTCLYMQNIAQLPNAKLISLPRLMLMQRLYPLGKDGACFRELKYDMALEEGVIFANLKALKKLGYIDDEEIEVNGRKMTLFYITDLGKENFEKSIIWLKEVIK